MSKGKEKKRPLSLEETVDLLGAEPPEYVGPPRLDPIGMRALATKIGALLKRFHCAQQKLKKPGIKTMSEAERSLKALIGFAYPDITRGPANNAWIKAVKEAARSLGWPVCPRCKGEGDPTCCTTCLNTGYVDPDDI